MSVRVVAPAMIVGMCTMGFFSPNAYSQSCTSSCSSSNCQGNQGTVCCKPVGPDVIVGVILGSSDANSFNTSAETLAGVSYDAFSIGTSSCNVGNQNIVWQAFSSNRHPAISQNLFRVRTEANGVTKIEQLGQSWLKHGFTALTQNACGCVCSGAGGSVLGVGCSDPYTATRNASQGGLGPKWQVDASSGWFPTGGPANPSFTGTTARRLRAKSSDLSTTTANLRYFVEAQYVTQDDAAAGNKNNNPSYREVFFSGGPTEWSMSTQSSVLTQREKAGILAWKQVDPAVTITNIVTPETRMGDYNPVPSGVQFPLCCDNALVIVGAKATDLGNGLWNYEYAVQNVNSHRSIASFSVPLSPKTVVSNVSFFDVDYHSGDAQDNFATSSINFDGTDWPAVVSSNSIKWETVPFAQNNRSNAIRWGTLYNFRFIANAPPTTGNVTLGTYRVVGSVTGTTVVPGDPNPQPFCPDPTNDGLVNVNDLLAVINAWGPCAAPCPSDVAPQGGNGVVDVNDLLAIINAWGPCP